MADTTGTTILGLSKTSIAGFLSFLIATLTTLVAFQAPAAIMTPQSSHVLLYITAGANLAVALCRVWVGMIQGDAPTTPPTP